MPLKRANIERQLVTADENLAVCVSKLKAGGVDPKAYRKNAIWRNLDATRRQLRTRLVSVKATEDREVACAAKKAEAEASK